MPVEEKCESKFPSFHILVKPCGPICNLNCTYCYYISKARFFPPDERFFISDEILETFTKQYIELNRGPELIFTWQGGEPTLMGISFFRRVLEFQEKYQPPGLQIINAIQTNGTLLNDEWGRFLREHHFLVGISVDGPRELHNIYRVDKEGKPTFKRVMRGIKILKAHNVEFNVLVAVHAGNFRYPLEVYNFIKEEIGARFIQFIPVVALKAGQVAPYSVPARGYGKFLTSIFDEWVRWDVGKIYVQIFEEALAAWAGLPGSLCTFAETCGNCPILEHNGDLYSCDFYVDSHHKLGNILHTPLIELVRSKKQIEFGLRKKTTLPHYCRECEYRFACNGGCPRNRFLRTPNGEPGLNYLCEGYKLFFAHINRAMQFMAGELLSGRAPANIMRHLR